MTCPRINATIQRAAQKKRAPVEEQFPADPRNRPKTESGAGAVQDRGALLKGHLDVISNRVKLVPWLGWLCQADHDFEASWSLLGRSPLPGRCSQISPALFRKHVCPHDTGE